MKPTCGCAWLALAIGILASCERPVRGTAATIGDSAEMGPADAFFARVAEHCGRAFAGRVIANRPPRDSDPFEGRALIMHVRECRTDEFRIPFHVGTDRSRTWILTRTPAGLRLKHDHRHEDGSHDAVTMYGGDTRTPGTAIRQEFPADDASRAIFTRHGLTASLDNVWAIEIEPGRRFLYELARPAHGRLFQVAFDLATPVPPPPAPWGQSEEIGGRTGCAPARSIC